MIVEMEKDLEELIHDGDSKIYQSILRNRSLYDGLMRAYQIMIAVNCIEELKLYSFLHYEKLKYEYSGLSSIRLSNRYVHRLIFEEKEDRLTLRLITIDNTHYGNKK